MPNITIYLDNERYVQFHKLDKKAQEEIRKNIQELTINQIEMKSHEKGLGVKDDE